MGMFWRGLHKFNLLEAIGAFLFPGYDANYSFDFKADDTAKYPIGTIMRVGKKEFIYAKAAGTLKTYTGVKNSLKQKVDNCAVQANYAAGVKKITITSAISCTLDELVGGEVVVFVSATESFTRGIVGNSAMTATDTLTLYLDHPTPIAITTAMTAEAIASPYSAVVTLTGSGITEFTPVMGVPMVAATTGQFVWLQVSGLMWLAPEAQVGTEANAMELCFGGDGAIRTRDSGTPGQQRAGIIVSTSHAGGTQGAPFIMLNIDH